jgi:hypothetical protein
MRPRPRPGARSGRRAFRPPPPSDIPPPILATYPLCDSVSQGQRESANSPLRGISGCGTVVTGDAHTHRRRRRPQGVPRYPPSQSETVAAGIREKERARVINPRPGLSTYGRSRLGDGSAARAVETGKTLWGANSRSTGPRPPTSPSRAPRRLPERRVGRQGSVFAGRAPGIRPEALRGLQRG